MLPENQKNLKQGFQPGGLAGWLMARFRPRKKRQPRLELIERITLSPRQSLALVEVEGRRFLVACSADSTPAFLPIGTRAARNRAMGASRLSW
ncbi:MAG: flagellar biosynthetic protein FliO [Terracidiphilus sp.]|nr:flagellar biosynthetic protein FliO [Terracidiphilus sp.]